MFLHQMVSYLHVQRRIRFEKRASEGLLNGEGQSSKSKKRKTSSKASSGMNRKRKKRGKTSAAASDDDNDDGRSREFAAAELLQLAGGSDGSHTQSVDSRGDGDNNGKVAAQSQGTATQAPTLPDTINLPTNLPQHHQSLQQAHQAQQLALLLQQRQQAQAMDTVALQQLLRGDNCLDGTSNNATEGSGININLLHALLVQQQQQQQQQQQPQFQQQQLLQAQRNQIQQIQQLLLAQAQVQAQAQAKAQAQLQQIQLQQLLSQAAIPQVQSPQAPAQNVLAGLLGAAAQLPASNTNVDLVANLAAVLNANNTALAQPTSPTTKSE